VLGELEAANFLVSSQDGKGATYRYHTLLRDCLLARLDQLQPKELRSLQRRTALWAWRHGDPETAFRHAIAGEDWDLADELTAEAWNVVVFGVAARDRDAVSETPEAELEGRPGLACRVAAAHLFLGNRREAERIFQIGERGLEGASPDRRDALAVISATFRLTIARLEGDYARVLELAGELEAQPIVGNFAVEMRERARQAIVLSNLGTCDVATGNVAGGAERIGDAPLPPVRDHPQKGVLALQIPQHPRALVAGAVVHDHDFVGEPGWAEGLGAKPDELGEVGGLVLGRHEDADIQRLGRKGHTRFRMRAGRIPS